MLPSGRFLNEETQQGVGWGGELPASYGFIPQSRAQAERDILEASRRTLQGRQRGKTNKDWEVKQAQGLQRKLGEELICQNLPRLRAADQRQAVPDTGGMDYCIYRGFSSHSTCLIPHILCFDNNETDSNSPMGLASVIQNAERPGNGHGLAWPRSCPSPGCLVAEAECPPRVQYIRDLDPPFCSLGAGK